MYSIILSIVALLALSFYALFKWVTKKWDFFKERGIPYKKLREIKCKNIAEYVNFVYNAFPNEKIYGYFDRREPMYMIRDPELLKQLSVKDFDYFEDHRQHIDVNVDELFGNSLFFMRGEKWRDMRSTLSPAFTGSKMRQMFDLIIDIADDMTNYLGDELKQEPLKWEITDLCSRYTNDVIASSAFGIKINSLKDEKNDFMVTGEKFRDLSNPKVLLRLVLIMAFPRLMRALGLTFIEKKVTDFFTSIIFDTMAEREKKKIVRPDMINILMQVRQGNALQVIADGTDADEFGIFSARRALKRKWTDNELVAQCLLFFTAGFNPVSDLLAFTLYELAVHPEIQDKLHAEISEVSKHLNAQPLNYDTLKELKYLDQVVSETLRKWPPAPLIDRLCVKDYILNLDGKLYEFPTGIGYALPIYGFHHDPNYFPNPDDFDPERFSDKNKQNIVPGTYIPFGLGPRTCIGNRLALMESKALLYYLLLKFKVETNAKTDIPLKLQNSFVNLNALNGIHLDFKPRSR